MPLNTKPNFKEHRRPVFRYYSPGDDFYEMLIRVHDGLSDAQSHELNAKLVLILSNHIGDLAVLEEALKQGRASVDPIDQQ
jgi:hypothetical protein